MERKFQVRNYQEGRLIKDTIDTVLGKDLSQILREELFPSFFLAQAFPKSRPWSFPFLWLCINKWHQVACESYTLKVTPLLSTRVRWIDTSLARYKQGKLCNGRKDNQFLLSHIELDMSVGQSIVVPGKKLEIQICGRNTDLKKFGFVFFFFPPLSNYQLYIMQYYKFLVLAQNVPLNPHVPFYSTLSIQDWEKILLAWLNLDQTLERCTRQTRRECEGSLEYYERVIIVLDYVALTWKRDQGKILFCVPTLCAIVNFYLF